MGNFTERKKTTVNGTKGTPPGGKKLGTTKADTRMLVSPAKGSKAREGATVDLGYRPRGGKRVLERISSRGGSREISLYTKVGLTVVLRKCLRRGP